MQKTPLEDTNLQSELIKAGVRFDFNIVDTVCHRKLSLTFYLAIIAILLVVGLPPGMPGNPVESIEVSQVASSIANDASSDVMNVGGVKEISSGQKLIFYSALVILVTYVIYYLLRLGYFLILRAKLRKDQAPIVVEAYSVVCLDNKLKPSDYIMPYIAQMLGKNKHYFCKYAVIYKEVGSEQPRFYLTAAVSSRKLCFIPEHIGRVFPHRKRNHLYTLDDKSAYQTASEKRRVMGNILVPSSNMTCKDASDHIVGTSGSGSISLNMSGAASFSGSASVSGNATEQTRDESYSEKGSLDAQQHHATSKLKHSLNK